MKGSLEVICGPMFCGKSEELIRRVNRAKIAKQMVTVFKPEIDNRFSTDSIVSRSGAEISAKTVKDARDTLWWICDVAAFDEAQFFGEELIEVVNGLIEDGVRVIVSGLDQDYREQPFGVMPQLLAMADEVTKLKAVCMVCHNEATTTQRLVDGKPASYKEETILVGNTEAYEARCRDCHQAA